MNLTRVLDAEVRCSSRKASRACERNSIVCVIVLGLGFRVRV